MKIITSIFLVYCLNIIIEDGSAIQCYNCVSSRGQNSPCERNVTAITPFNCTSTDTHCLTYFTNSTVERKCASNDGCNSLRNLTGFISCYTCNSPDLCNNQTLTGAGFVSSLTGGLTVTTLLSIILISL